MEVSPHSDPQKPRGVLVINLAENRVWQVDPVNFPSTLRRNFRRSIVKVLVFTLQETEIDFVELVVENLLRVFITMRRCVRREKDTILIFVEELARGSRLASQLSNARRNVDVHVREAIEAFRYVLQIFREIPSVKNNEGSP